jgi:acyl carrier protein phosphodiesterase
MYYDHFLASLWKDYHAVPLELYSKRVYATVRSHWAILPERARFMFPYMERHNWLAAYAYPEGIGRALSGMAHRTRFDSGMEDAVEDLLAQYDAFQSEFEAFFPDLMAFVEQEVPGIRLGGL